MRDMRKKAWTIYLSVLPTVSFADRYDIHGPSSSASGEQYALALVAYSFLLYTLLEWWSRRSRGVPMGQTESQWVGGVWAWLLYAIIALGMNVPLVEFLGADDLVSFIVCFGIVAFLRQT